LDKNTVNTRNNGCDICIIQKETTLKRFLFT
jgi:hypothetical protein